MSILSFLCIRSTKLRNDCSLLLFCILDIENSLSRWINSLSLSLSLSLFVSFLISYFFSIYFSLFSFRFSFLCLFRKSIREYGFINWDSTLKLFFTSYNTFLPLKIWKLLSLSLDIRLFSKLLIFSSFSFSEVLFNNFKLFCLTRFFWFICCFFILSNCVLSKFSSTSDNPKSFIIESCSGSFTLFFEVTSFSTKANFLSIFLYGLFPAIPLVFGSINLMLFFNLSSRFDFSFFIFFIFSLSLFLFSFSFSIFSYGKSSNKTTSISFCLSFLISVFLFFLLWALPEFLSISFIFSFIKSWVLPIEISIASAIIFSIVCFNLIISSPLFLEEDEFGSSSFMSSLLAFFVIADLLNFIGSTKLNFIFLLFSVKFIFLFAIFPIFKLDLFTWGFFSFSFVSSTLIILLSFLSSYFFFFIKASISLCCLFISLLKKSSSSSICNVCKYKSSGFLFVIIYISFAVEYIIGISFLFLWIWKASSVIL